MESMKFSIFMLEFNSVFYIVKLSWSSRGLALDEDPS
jgi:hypothetical protein